MRIVLDTNQFVSALLYPERHQGRILQAWRMGRFELVMSDPLVAELRDVLRRPYFRERRRITEEKVSDLVDLLHRYAVWVPGATALDVVPDDPTDNKILACAAEGEADVLISGDSHLLDLKVYKNIPVITAAEFWNQLEKTRSDPPRGE